MRAIILLVLVVFAASYHVRDQHQYWYTAARKTAKSGVPFADVAWNYCDYKCLTMEKFHAGVDFYVVNFKDAIYKPNFSACYAKTTGGTPRLWSQVASNKWYEKNCGDDDEDYLKNSKYEKVSEEGVGIGTLIQY